ncbi:MAG: DNA cytosine methyltransferase [Gammaproteobacteria bacterium]|nr:DNA cytosine methyltransferase [Gammaproteobacteria bacterium]
MGVIKKIPASLSKNYAGTVSRILRPAGRSKYEALDLYSGAGGLSLGLEAAGFRVTGIDSDADSAETYNSNLRGTCINDSITPRYGFPRADLLVGGPPCQPFSVRGRQEGASDHRNGIPSFIAAVRKLRPRMWVFENVRGMMYRNRAYLASSVKKLEKLGYDVDVTVENCSDYGVPQNRERVIVVGHRGKYVPPRTLGTQVTSGAALKKIPRGDREKPIYLTRSMDRYISAYERASHCRRPRDLDRGRVARTLTCRNLGGSSSDMHRICTPNGKRRMLFVREAARLQGFPDWFEFSGSRYSQMRQIGNAVPPLFALVLGIQMRKCLES